MIPHHTVTGPDDAPVLVLSNSLGATMEMWDPQADALAERFRLVRYDQRGHGGSETPPGPYSIEDMGRDVLGLLDHLGVDRAHVAGLSLGGMAAMWLGFNAPERVDRLVLLCTSPLMGPAQMWADRAVTVREQGTQAIVDATLERWFTEDYRAEPRHRRPGARCSSASTTRATPTAARSSSTWTSPTAWPRSPRPHW